MKKKKKKGRQSGLIYDEEGDGPREPSRNQSQKKVGSIDSDQVLINKQSSKLRRVASNPNSVLLAPNSNDSNKAGSDQVT